MIDSHTHIDMCDGDPAVVVANASISGVNRMLTIGLTAKNYPAILAIAEQHESVFAAVGWHPNETTGYGDEQSEAIRLAAKHPRVRAIGETGLDFFRENAPADDQRRAFLAQIEIATECGLPLTIHARNAEAEVVDLLGKHAAGVPNVVLHCFSEPDVLDAAIERGYCCSFAGNVT